MAINYKMSDTLINVTSGVRFVYIRACSVVRFCVDINFAGLVSGGLQIFLHYAILWSICEPLSFPNPQFFSLTKQSERACCCANNISAYNSDPF